MGECPPPSPEELERRRKWTQEREEADRRKECKAQVKAKRNAAQSSQDNWICLRVRTPPMEVKAEPVSEGEESPTEEQSQVGQMYRTLVRRTQWRETGRWEDPQPLGQGYWNRSRTESPPSSALHKAGRSFIKGPARAPVTPERAQSAGGRAREPLPQPRAPAEAREVSRLREPLPEPKRRPAGGSEEREATPPPDYAAATRHSGRTVMMKQEFSDEDGREAARQEGRASEEERATAAGEPPGEPPRQRQRRRHRSPEENREDVSLLEGPGAQAEEQVDIDPDAVSRYLAATRGSQTSSRLTRSLEDLARDTSRRAGGLAADSYASGPHGLLGEVGAERHQDEEELFRLQKAAALVGHLPDKFKGHSLRTGGATAQYHGFQDMELAKREGRWNSGASHR